MIALPNTTSSTPKYSAITIENISTKTVKRMAVRREGNVVLFSSWRTSLKNLFINFISAQSFFASRLRPSQTHPLRSKQTNPSLKIFVFLKPVLLRVCQLQLYHKI